MYSPLPLIIAGPLLRRCDQTGLVLWLVTRAPLSGEFIVYDRHQQPLYRASLQDIEQCQIGQQAWVVLAHFEFEVPTDVPLYYQLNTQEGDLFTLLPHLFYQHDELIKGQRAIEFRVPERAQHVIHGSCRCPHTDNQDALAYLASQQRDVCATQRPDVLMFTGDQIYADEVAGPTLQTIHAVINALGLPEEDFRHLKVANSQQLYQHPETYYGRDVLLPRQSVTRSKFLWPWSSDSIFTSGNCANHLMTFSEFFAMYLLVWSPNLWHQFSSAWQHPPKTLSGETLKQWHHERSNIEDFIAGLSDIQALLAHVPSYMIFDDHDITDDWNLTIGWEQAVYQHPDARQIINNGLMAYWLCQGWGNAPKQFTSDFKTSVCQFFQSSSPEHHLEAIKTVEQFEAWHYVVDSTPKMVVLDTRTRRWRSESKMNKPSGLMDWEALIEMHQELVDQKAVILVSAAPIFGVKFIEVLQRAVTWLGFPLAVDAENWMAHPGSANTLLSIFTHTQTPANFVILSGDVHYSFAYDIKLRFRKAKPTIYQITCSGIKNTFPRPLLAVCEWADKYLYSPHSPLNWLTKRKRLQIHKRHTDQTDKHLVNHSALGEVKFDRDGRPTKVAIRLSSGEMIEFLPSEVERDTL